MNFFFFGDSICFGQFISPHKIWINKLSQTMDDLYNDKITIINASVNGNTTRMALDRLQYDVLTHPIDFIYIQFGLNDCNFWEHDKGLPRISEKEFKTNLDTIINKCKIYNLKNIFIGTNHKVNKYDIYNNNNIRYNNIIREVSNYHNIILIDHEINMNLFNPIEYLLPDNIHLNEYGHIQYYNFSKWIILKHIYYDLHT